MPAKYKKKKQLLCLAQPRLCFKKHQQGVWFHQLLHTQHLTRQLKVLLLASHGHKFIVLLQKTHLSWLTKISLIKLVQKEEAQHGKKQPIIEGWQQPPTTQYLFSFYMKPAETDVKWFSVSKLLLDRMFLKYASDFPNPAHQLDSIPLFTARQSTCGLFLGLAILS